MHISSSELFQSIEAIVKPYQNKSKRCANPILSIGVLSGNERFIFGFGDLQPFGRMSYGDLVYEIGSLTKVFTTSLLALMIEEGLIRSDDSIGQYIPSLSCDHPVKLSHLATHSSGFHAMPILKIVRNLFEKKVRDVYCKYTLEEAISFLRSVPAHKTGKKFLYSNEGMGVLGQLLAQTLETDYETAVMDRICSPLDMPDTRITLSDEQRTRLVPGHGRNGKPRPELNLRDFPGAGALRSTVNDQLTFMSAHLGLHPDKKRCSLFSSTHQVQLRPAKSMGVGLGWMVEESDNIIWHNGSTMGFSSFMGIQKDILSGVVVLSNYRSGLLGASPLQIGFAILKHLEERFRDTANNSR